MQWVKTEDQMPPSGIKVLAYFELNDEYDFNGYAVVSRVRFKKMNSWVDEYWFDIPGENFADCTPPIRWCLIEED